VLHVGSYANKEPTIQALHAFIAEQGLAIDGQRRYGEKASGSSFRGASSMASPRIRACLPQVRPRGRCAAMSTWADATRAG
jgi:hypothetical protein